MQLDGLGYTTPGYFLRHYAARAMRVKSWLGVGARLARKVTAGAAVDEAPVPLSESFFFDFPPRDQVRSEIVQLLDRGTRLLYVYTGGVAEQYFNHRDQFEEMFGSLAHAADRLDIDYVADADHLYADYDHRQALFTRIETWIKKFPS